MDAVEITSTELKNILKQLNLKTTGNKAELLARLDASHPRETWIGMLQEKRNLESVEDSRDTVESVAGASEQRAPSAPTSSDPNLLARELDFMRRERELMRRELVFMHRENESLRNSPRTDTTVRTPNVSLKSVSDYLRDFDGTTGTFMIWENEIKKIRTIHNLDDNAIKLLVGAKVKGKVATWLHSKAEYVEMDVDSLLEEMKKMFDHRPSKLLRRRKFEERKWKPGEPYSEYHHDKIILGNEISLEQDELIECIIDGIPDGRLRDNARLQRFSSIKVMFEAFENIMLRNDNLLRSDIKPRAEIKKSDANFSMKSKKWTGQNEIPTAQMNKCFNCNQEGHYAGSCPKPKRERGSCFRCGRMGHRLKNCPESKEEHKSNSANTTALVETSGRHGKQEVIRLPVELEDQPRKPLTEPTKGYCVLIKNETEKEYYVEALIDSGSKINIMNKSTYVNFFNSGELVEDKPDENYGGINSSPLSVIGHITSRICLHLLPDYIFDVRFVIVPDSTMTYDVLLGREFLTTPGLHTTFDRSVQMKYNERVCDIMNIEAIEQSNPLNIVSDNLCSLLSFEIREQLLQLLNAYIHSTGKTEDIPYRFEIQLTDAAKPFYFTPRRLSWSERNEVRNMVDGLLRRKIIRPSNSNYCSPIVLVKKKNGTNRMCIDYRTLNKITVKDRYPLPLVEDQIDQLSGKSYFTSLDLKDGFHHVPIDENSIKFTSFVTPDGQFEYLKLPFGLANAPAVFQRSINIIFKPLLDSKKVQLYLDDIMIATHTVKDNLEVLEEVLQLLARYGLELNLSKCQFLKREIEYLGYNISEKGVKPNKVKIEAVQNFPVPKTAKEVQSFLGLTGYFRKFIPNYARIAKPLHDLTKKDVPFNFGKNELDVFETLRNKLICYPVLALYNPTARTELHTDASSHGYGAVLLQEQPDARMHPIMYYSRRTTAAESRYHSYELETLAIVHALERFRVYLQGIPFLIVTDCNALKLAVSKKDVNPRISRWCMMLQNYNYTIEHRPGDRMRHVDALSRNVLIIEPLSFDQMLVYRQLQDPIIRKLREELEIRESDKYELRNGVVYRKQRGGILFYVPEAMTNDIIRMCHDEVGHVGPEKTVDIINRTYWFPCMRARTKDYIVNCIKCLTYATPTGKVEGKLHIYEKGTKPFSTLHIDHYGPLERMKYGFKHIFIVIDAFTKYVALYSVKSTATKEVIACLKQYFHHFGSCRRIVSDRGSCFVSEEFARYLLEMNVEHVKAATASPQSNGQVERVNRFLRAVLSKLSAEGKWTDCLAKRQFCLNNTLHKSIGTTPSLLLFGTEQYGFVDDDLREYFREIQHVETSRDDLRNDAVVRNRASQEYNKRVYDSRHKKPNVYSVGDYVMIKNVVTASGVNQKLCPKYKGPYIVKTVLDRDRYIISDIEGFQLTQRPFTGTFGPERLKPWIRQVQSEDVCESDQEYGRDDHSVRMAEL